MKTVFRLFRHRRLSGINCKQIVRRLIAGRFLTQFLRRAELTGHL